MLRVVHLILLVTYILWPVVAWASAVTLAETLGTVGILDVVAVAGLSAFSGGVAMLQRMEREAAPAVPWRWISAHMLASLLAGSCGFFGAEALDLGTWYEVLVIILCGWLGARAIDRAADRLLGRVDAA